MKRSLDMDEKEDLKVLIVTESYPPESYGGGEISCALMAESLVDKDVEVSILTSGSEKADDLETRNGVRVFRKLKTGKSRDSLVENLKRKMYLKSSVKKEVPKLASDHDLIHFFNITSITELPIEKPTFATINSYINFCPKGNLFYKEESVCEGCEFTKFLGCITNSEYVGNQKLNRFLKYNPLFWLTLYQDYKRRKRCLNYVDRFFSLSGFITDMLMKEGVDLGNIVKVPNISEIDISEEREDQNITTDKPLVAYIGALTKIKGVDLLIKAFDKIDLEAELLIVGDGPEKENIEDLAAGDANIRFLGRIDHEDISSIYDISDVIVVSSLWPEPLSRVLLESAHLGKPVLATDIGGNPEVVEEGYNGFLFRPEVDDLASKLEKILSEDEKRVKMGENMKNFYEENLSKEKVVGIVLDTYLKTLEDQ
ncbi:MAG: glycosyltransferase family 4 protein [Candidatus Natronoplasma sp.]